MPESYSGPLDYQFSILLFIIACVLAALVLPTPPKRRRPTPTEDTTKTRRAL